MSDDKRDKAIADVVALIERIDEIEAEMHKDLKDTNLAISTSLNGFNAIIERSRNGELGSSKVLDMQKIAIANVAILEELIEEKKRAGMERKKRYDESPLD